MARYIKTLVLVLGLLAAVRPSQAFSLLGPFDTWQTGALGYNPSNSDIGAPKNLGEEYRWNVPVITYGFDNSFLSYFGSNGVAAIDAAMKVFNDLPAFSTLSADLNEYPLIDPATGAYTTFRDARRVNLRAQADGLVDLKSVAMGLVIEELGLASPERWTWALRDRKLAGTDPERTNYLVMQRNFDPGRRPDPSRYVNGTRYTYQVLEFENPTFADAVEFTIDPSDPSFSAVASISGFLFNTGLDAGTFYTSLTRDDIGGLRYLYAPENRNLEPFPAGTQIFQADRTNLITLTNLDLTLLSLRSLTNSPATLSNFYPGIIINRADPFLTNPVAVILQIVTQQVTLPAFTNRDQLTIVSNIDLNAFSSLSLTSPPAAMLQAFPGLIITSTNFSTTTRVDVASIYLTNAPNFPWGNPLQINFVFVTNFFTNLIVQYHYTYSNVVTNFSSPVTVVRREVFGLEREPWGDPLNPTFRTNVSEYVENIPSGGIIILPPGVAGYEFTGPAQQNVIVNTNINFLATIVTNGVIRTVGDIEYRFFTNFQYAAFPIQYFPQGLLTNILVTNYVTNTAIYYNLGYANVITNYSGPVTPAVSNVFVISTNPFVPSIVTTQVTSVNVTLPLPSGGFLIDTNLTGFEFTGWSNQVVIPVTNIVADFYNPQTGQRTVSEVVYMFTNTTYLVYPFVATPFTGPVLRPGIDELTFVKFGDGTIEGQPFAFTNRYRASYYTNSTLFTNTFEIVQAQPDITFSAADLGVLQDSVRPVQYSRSANFSNQSAINNPNNPAGPGVIVPPVIIAFNNIGPTLFNQAPGAVSEAATLQFRLFQPFVWARFDGSTNPPVVFPEDLTLEQIESRVFNANQGAE